MLQAWRLSINLPERLPLVGISERLFYFLVVPQKAGKSKLRFTDSKRSTQIERLKSIWKEKAITDLRTDAVNAELTLNTTLIKSRRGNGRKSLISISPRGGASCRMLDYKRRDYASDWGR